MKHFFTAVCCLLLLKSAVSQEGKGSIRGSVKNIQNEPMPGASILLTWLTDTTNRYRAIADSKGSFGIFKLNAGTYRLTVTAAGMIPYINEQITLDAQRINIALPAVILQTSKSSELKEVVVTSKRPLIEQDIDKTIVNVDAMISSAGSNALEILSKTPGVTVGLNNEIGLNGKEGVLVMIDGRATYLSAGDLASYLKLIPGNLLDKIELMDNPSAKYDAAGSAIINIRMKKNRVGGFTGNIAASYSQGVYARHNESININYNRKKVNLFGSLSYSNEENYTLDQYDRKFYESDKSLASSAALRNFQSYSSNSYYARVGMDYLISPKTTYGFNINMNINPRNGKLDYTSNSVSELQLPDSTGMGNITGTSDRNNWGANMNMTHKFDNNGRELSADVNYLSYSNPGEQSIMNAVYSADGTGMRSERFFYDLLPVVDIYTIKADYTHPLPGKTLLEMGAKSGVVKNDDNAQHFDVEGNHFLPDYSKSNHFIYKEQIHAAYLNAKKMWKRLGVQLGLRAEHTRLEGTLLANPATEKNMFNRRYTSFFPSAFVNYKLDSNGNNTLGFNISRRIRRPGYQQLNPFVAFRYNDSYSSGNPMIGPQYQYRAELKYQYRQLLGISLQYGRFTDIIFDVTQVVDNVFLTRPDNVAKGRMLMLATNINKNISDWWNINANVMLAHLSLDGMAYSERLNPGTATIRLNILNQFNFKKGWSGELTVYYSGKDIAGQAIVSPRYRVYGAVQKKILKEKGTIRLGLEDIFHSWVQKDNSVALKNASSYHFFESDTQRAGITFTWRFGKDSFARKRKHADNAADAEAERVN